MHGKAFHLWSIPFINELLPSFRRANLPLAFLRPKRTPSLLASYINRVRIHADELVRHKPAKLAVAKGERSAISASRIASTKIAADVPLSTCRMTDLLIILRMPGGMVDVTAFLGPLLEALDEFILERPDECGRVR